MSQPEAQQDRDHTFLWVLTQRQNRGFDTFDSCVVAADDEASAKLITPDNTGFRFRNPRWAYDIEHVTAEKLGVCKGNRRGTVIISSFNAG